MLKETAMFYLYPGNRTENLAAVLAALCEKFPLKEAFAPEEILIAAPGIARYLDTALAQKLSVAANIRYSSIPVFFWRLIAQMLPELSRHSVYTNAYAPDVLRWHILRVLLHDMHEKPGLAPVREALQSYCAAYDTAAYALAGELAALFDQYLVYRPDWIAAWEKGKTTQKKDDAERWQMLLWQEIAAKIHTPHRIALLGDLLEKLQKNPQQADIFAPKLPERVFLFAFSAMAPVYLQLFAALSQHTDVHLFVLNPAREYWGDILSAQQILRDKNENSLRMLGHPLLASLGKQGRDFFDMLNDTAGIEEKLDGRLFAENEEKTLLARLQNDLLNLRMPEKRDLRARDHSIMLQAAHNPLRELQILKDALLDFLRENPEKTPDDIAVLSPDIETYVPFIDTVFGKNAPDNCPLPYCIADTKISRNKPYLHAWRLLLEIFSSRFETGPVTALLDNDCVLRRFALSREDVPAIRETVQNLRVRWAENAAEREKYGGQDDLFTWQQALDRMAAGLLLPEDTDEWQGIFPHHSDIALLPVLAKFCLFVQTLAQQRALWQQNADIAQWAQRIREISAALLLPEDSADSETFFAHIDAWQENCAAADFADTLTPAVAGAHLQGWLDSYSEAGFLRGGVTFCSMMPLRNLPFAVVALIGMNSNAFPRAPHKNPFDLVAKYPRKGDRSRRDDDRYLFLECLLSARHTLYLSYIGRDVRDNAELAPSELVHELCDTLAAMTGRDFFREKRVMHPLQAFSPRYFQKDSGSLKPSYRADYAHAYGQKAAETAPFWQGTYPENPPEPAATQFVGIDEFLAFWKDPVKGWLNRHLQWKDNFIAAAEEGREPFILDKNGEAEISEAYFDALRANPDDDLQQTGRHLTAQNLFPAAQLGELLREELRQNALAVDKSYFAAGFLPPQVFECTIGKFIFSGSLKDLTDDNRQILFFYKEPNSRQTVQVYLQHLIAGAVAPTPPATHIVTPRKNSILPAYTSRGEAHALLEKWLLWYAAGQNMPLPFFAGTSLAAAESLANPKNSGDGFLKNAAGKWHSSNRHTGEADYETNKTVFGRDEIPPFRQPLFRTLAEELLLPLVQKAKTE